MFSLTPGWIRTQPVPFGSPERWQHRGAYNATKKMACRWIAQGCIIYLVLSHLKEGSTTWLTQNKARNQRDGM